MKGDTNLHIKNHQKICVYIILGLNLGLIVLIPDSFRAQPSLFGELQGTP